MREWTWDWYDSTWYGKAGAIQSDTPGPGSGTYRVLRGGSWASSNASYCRSAYRGYAYPDFTLIGFIGFRRVVAAGSWMAQ